MPEDQRLRPGIVGGAYPERRDPAPTGAARALHRLIGSLARRRQSDRLADVVREIERQGQAIAEASSARLSEVTTELRHRFAREGFCPAAGDGFREQARQKFDLARLMSWAGGDFAFEDPAEIPGHSDLVPERPTRSLERLSL